MKTDIFESIQGQLKAVQGQQRLQKDELRLPSLPAPMGYRNGSRNEGNLPFLGREEPPFALLYSVDSGLKVGLQSVLLKIKDLLYPMVEESLVLLS